MAVKIEPCDGGVRLWVKVVPGASRDRLVGALGDALKIAVSKPPQGGAANLAVIRLLATQLQISGRQIQIVRGHTNPRKQIQISGLTPALAAQRLGIV